MQNPFFTFICISLLLSASLVTGKEMSHEKPMNMDAMMEAYQKLATPG